MAERAITAEEIDHVLASPHTVHRSRTRLDRLVVLGVTSRGRRLKVVVSADDPSYVVTVADRDSEL